MSVNSTVGVFGSDEVSMKDTSTYVKWTENVLPVFTAIKVCIGITGFIGNSFVVFVMYKYRKLFVNMKTVYVINQSVLDAVTSAVLILTSLSTARQAHLTDSVLDDLFCRLWLTQILLWGLIISSTYNLMIISVERYMAIAHPLWHLISFSDAKIHASVGVVWMFGISLLASYMVPTSRVSRGRCIRAHFWPSKVFSVAVVIVQNVVNIVVPITVHCVCYTRILRTLKTRVIPGDQAVSPAVLHTDLPSISRTIAEPSTTRDRDRVRVWYLRKDTRASTVQNCERHRQNMKATKNVNKAFAIVTACFFVCWIPNKIYVFLYMVGFVSDFREVYEYTVIMVFLNCCINPFIYVANYDAFKYGLAKLFRRR